MKNYLDYLCLALFAVSSVSPATAFCIFSCEPTENNAKDVLTNILRHSFKTTSTVVSFQKTNGAKANVVGLDMYGIEFRADISFPEGFVPKENDFLAGTSTCKGQDENPFFQYPKLQEFKSSLSMNWIVKSGGGMCWDPVVISTAGIVEFTKTEKGWKAADGNVY